MKISLLGYGRMGKMVEATAVARGHTISQRVVTTRAALELLSDPDVAIDFSAPESAEDLCLAALRQGITVVSGTTGWNTERVIAYASQPDRPAFLHASNMSIGVNVAFAVNQVLAKALAPYDYRPSITEIHHVHKLDAPSGTAITLAEGVLAEATQLTRWQLQGDTLADGQTLPIESIREGEVIGHHIVRYTSAIDALTLTHEAFSRDGFALGAVLAAEYLTGRRGVFTMSDVLALDRLLSPA